MTYLEDSLTTIKLTKTTPDELIYEIQSHSKQFVVFSEMYYPFGWTAYVNGEESPIVNVNYVLRGLEVPAGESTVVFRFRPRVVALGSQIRLVSFILLILFFGGFYFYAKPRFKIQSS